MRVVRFLGVQARLIALLLIASTIVVVSESADPVGASPCPASNVSVQLTYTYSAPNCIARYDYLGAMQTFTVPTGITSLTFQVVAASGGRFLWNGSASSASPGGTGGSVSGTLTVTPGATLNLFVGGQGGSPTAGWNGGGTGGRCTLCDPATPIAGGGGGASDIRIGGTALANRRVTAGGGGGAGGYGGLSAAQADAGGGNGGSTAYNSGGVKGASGLSGSDGGSTFSEEGGGATPIAGGPRSSHDPAENHQSGTSGSGGNGRSNLYAGAGGGGFFGGGGANAGGGGGGSSRVDTTVVSGDSYASTNTGNGYIILTYAAPFPTVTINTTMSSPSRNSSFSYAVTFSSSVDAGTLSGVDFENAGIASGCQFSTTPSSGSATSFTLTVSSCSDGTIAPRLFAGSVTDGSGVTGPAANTTGNSITKDTSAPAAPGAPALAPVSDTGSSNSDNVTTDDTPAFSVSGGSTGDTATITATNGATSRSCTYVIGTGTSCDISPALSEGTWSVTGKLTDQAGNESAAGAATSLTVDRTAPSAPGAPDLAAASDSGSSDSDDLTNDTTPTLSLPGANTGETVEFTATQGATSRSCSYVVGVASSCDISPALGTGAWSVTAKVTDAAGNQSAAGTALPLTVDTTAPSAPGTPDLAASSDLGTSPTDNLTSDTTPTVSVSGGTSGDTMTVTATQGSTTRSCSYVVGPATSCDISPALGDGVWALTARLTDPAGNQSTAGSGLNITIDGTAPTLGTGPDLAASSDSGSSDTDNVTADTTPTMSLGGGSSGDRMTLTATNGATTVSCSYTIGSTSSCDLPTLTDGTWSVSGSIADPSGNTSSHGTPLSLRVDATAPAPTSPDLPAGSDSGASSTDDVTRDSTPSISVPGLSTGDQVTVTAARGSTSVTCTYTVGVADSCDLPTLADGTWSISAAIVDAAGNAGSTSSSLSLAVDTTPPSAPSAAPDLASSSDSGTSSSDDATNDTTPTVSLPGGTAGDTATMTATNGAVSLSCSYTVGSASSCDLPALTDGTWNIAGTYTDPAGNTSPAGPSLPVTIDSSSPTTPTKPDLATSSDSGASSTDNITSDSTPQFEMPGVEAGASVVVSATKGSETLTCTFVVSATTTGCSLPTLSDGTWSVSATATDTRGNVATTTQPLSLRIDTSNPFQDSVTSTETKTSTTTTVPKRTTTTTTIARRVTTTTTPRGGGGSAAGSTTVPRRPTTTTTTTVPKSPPGVPDLRTDSDTGSDRADNVTNDRTPVVGIEGLSDGDAVTMTARRKGSTVSCTYVVGQADGCRLPELSDGSWTIGADVVDLAGNSASAPESLEFRVDGTAPGDTLAISSTDDPADGAMTVEVANASDGNTVTVTATNGTSTVECSFVASTATNSCTLEGIEVGEWSVTAVSTDPAGNTGTPSAPFTFSLVPPTTSVPTTTVPPRNSKPVPGGDGSGDGNGDGSGTTPLSGDDAVRLLASMLALLAIRRRSGDGPERLGEGDREASGVAEYAAGTGSGGLDVREDVYRPPCSDRFDLAIRDLAGRTARFSPALGRSIDDGSYLRALVGMFWAILPAAGAVLGVVAALDTDSTVVLPALWIVLSLLAVGTLDAGAGLAAAVAYGTVMFAGGGLDSADALRGFMGIASLMFLVGLVASAMRPFRRSDGNHHGWNRLVDAVLIPLIGAWAAGTMYAAVPHLSGFDVPWSDRTGAVELCALLVLTARWGLENLARLTVSQRLALIENETLPEPVESLKMVSRVVRTAVFAFVAVVFIGSNWWLVAGSAMFLVPKLIEPITGRFPNNRRLHRALPRNLVRIVAMLLIMLWWGLWVGEVVDANEVQWAFVLMGIPGLAVGVADWFGREGDDWPSTATSRILGVLMLLLGVALVRGWLL